MATSRAQRVGIWVIAVAMVVGTLAGFIAMILSSQNDTKNQQALAKYQAEYAAYQKKVDAQAKELSGKYFNEFNQYKSVPSSYDPAAIKELSTNDLKIGDGAEITDKTEYSAYYIGWNPKGKVFDQSIDGQSLKAPIAGGNLIEGWNKGVIGMKVGGVRELTIPSNLAYKEQGSGEDIPPNTPIKFVVMIIPKPAEIKQPEITQEVIQAYGQQQR